MARVKFESIKQMSMAIGEGLVEVVVIEKSVESNSSDSDVSISFAPLGFS
jgi:hypothetical protein